MLYWECKRRLKGVREFRDLIQTYFSNLAYAGPRRAPHEYDEAQKARGEINARMGEVGYSCALIGHRMTVAYKPPSLLGGFQGNLNLLANLFDLREFHIPPAKVIDGLDRAIGDYQRLERRLYWKMFNPFFWIGWLFLKIIRIPFRILGAAGFDTEKIENSVGGRTIKAISGFVIFVSAILAGLAALQSLGWLDPTKEAVRSLFHLH